MSLLQEIYQLESALRREKLSPEILMYEDSLVSRILGKLDEKQEFLNTSPAGSLDEQFEYQIYQLDLDRIKYLMSNYLRTRLLKIQSLAITIVLKDQTSMLSNKEFEFLGKYYLLKTNHFKKSFLLKIPEEFRKIEHEEHSKTPITMPNLDKHVFVKALEDIGGLRLKDNLDIEVRKDDIFLLPFSAVKMLLKDNKVDLI